MGVTPETGGFPTNLAMLNGFAARVLGLTGGKAYSYLIISGVKSDETTAWHEHSSGAVSIDPATVPAGSGFVELDSNFSAHADSPHRVIKAMSLTTSSEVVGSLVYLPYTIWLSGVALTVKSGVKVSRDTTGDVSETFAAQYYTRTL